MPRWDIEGRDWPNRASSLFASVGGVRWHFQVMGDGPVVLLLHGAGAATHSWRGLAPLLAERFTVVAPDLPGHGFSSTPGRDGLTMPGMARGVAALLGALELSPALIAGHSAGAGVMARLVLDGLAEPRALVAINGALLPFPGGVAPLFQGIARALVNPFVAGLVAAGVRNGGMAERFLARTGSRIEPKGVAQYAALFGRPGHVAGTLGMMANWDLAALKRDLPRLAVPLTLLYGDRDTTIPPSVAREVAALVPGAVAKGFAGLGHLAHEERPALFAEAIGAVAGAHGVGAAVVEA